MILWVIPAYPDSDPHWALATIRPSTDLFRMSALASGRKIFRDLEQSPLQSPNTARKNKDRKRNEYDGDAAARLSSALTVAARTRFILLQHAGQQLVSTNDGQTNSDNLALPRLCQNCTGNQTVTIAAGCGAPGTLAHRCSCDTS